MGLGEGTLAENGITVGTAVADAGQGCVLLLTKLLAQLVPSGSTVVQLCAIGGVVVISLVGMQMVYSYKTGHSALSVGANLMGTQSTEGVASTDAGALCLGRLLYVRSSTESVVV